MREKSCILLEDEFKRKEGYFLSQAGASQMTTGVQTPQHLELLTI